MPRWLIDAAERHPDHPAVEDADGSVSFARLLELARRHDPRPRVPAEPRAQSVAQLHACLLAGVPAVLVDPRVPERPAAVDAPGAAFVVFTSGTTGAPKPVAIQPRQVEASAAAFAARLGTGTWLCPLPLSHVGGLMALLRPLLAGTTAVLGPADLVAREDIAFAALVPTQLQRLLDAGLRHPRARVILGGAPPPPALLDRARDAGVRVSVSYGMTETCSLVTLDGEPLDGVEIDVAGGGEIVVRGPMVAGGEHRTGDLGRFHAGRLQIIGRRSDTIITGGENVAPAQVEAVLAEHPGVADVAVIGRPDREWGEAVVALVVPAAGTALDPRALGDFCRPRLAPFAVPKAFEAVPELPRTASGKLLRRNLR